MMNNCIPLYAHELRAMNEHLDAREMGEILEAVALYMKYGNEPNFQRGTLPAFAFDLITMRMDAEEESAQEDDEDEDDGKAVQLLRLSDFIKQAADEEDEDE